MHVVKLQAQCIAAYWLHINDAHVPPPVHDLQGGAKGRPLCVCTWCLVGGRDSRPGGISPPSEWLRFTSPIVQAQAAGIRHFWHFVWAATPPFDCLRQPTFLRPRWSRGDSAAGLSTRSSSAGSRQLSPLLNCTSSTWQHAAGGRREQHSTRARGDGGTHCRATPQPSPAGAIRTLPRSFSLTSVA